MRLGRVEQVGTPEEVYARPRSTYVARFVGSPQMDILSGKIERVDGATHYRVGEASLPVPDEIDLQYAVAAALVGRAIRAKESGDGAGAYGPILEYARRFPQREMGVMLVSDMHRAIGEGIFQVPQFADWAQAISDVMLFDM